MKDYNVTNKKKFNCCKSDVYSLGLILLECGILQSIQSIYDFKYYVIDEDILDRCLILLAEYYPDNTLLVSTIGKMLEFNYINRPSFKEIIGKLPDFDTIKQYFKNEKLNNFTGKIFNGGRFIGEEYNEPSPTTYTVTPRVAITGNVTPRNHNKNHDMSGLTRTPERGIYIPVVSRSRSPSLMKLGPNRDDGMYKLPIRNVLNVVYDDQPGDDIRRRQTVQKYDTE